MRFIFDADDLHPEEFGQAIRNLLQAAPSLLTRCENKVIQYCREMQDAWGLEEDERIALNVPGDIWKHVRFGEAIHVSVRKRGDVEDGIYFSLECECDWEEEHGLQLIIRNGSQVTKIGPYGGHLTNSDAYADESLIGVVYRSLTAWAMSYAQFMQERIFTPLGMTATRTALPNRILMGRAAGYRLVNDRLDNREAIQPHTGRDLGHIATTVADMARWEQEQRQPRLLKPETAALAQQAVTLADGSATTYGYGWFTDQILPVPTLSHSGQTAGFVANYVRVPSRDLAVVLLTNLYGAPGGVTRIAQLVEPSLSVPVLVAAANADAKQWDGRPHS